MNPSAEHDEDPTAGHLDPMVVGTYRPLDPQVRHAAAITVCARARDVEEARVLLRALGLIPAPANEPDLTAGRHGIAG
jgi:hypothetical protein